MSALTLDRVRIDPPTILPVDHLSLNSIKTFMLCPEKWRRRYLDHEDEPASGKMVLGGAAGAALAQHYGHVIESGEGLCAEAVLDEFSSEWEDRRGREDVDYEGEAPGDLKDSGARALALYHQVIAPDITPVAVERKFELSWPGVSWTLEGFIDLETAEGEVADYKLSTKRLSQGDADADLQPTTYCAARRAEGDPAAAFRFHVMARTKQPTVELVATGRSERQLDLLTDRIFTIAREIEWRTQTDTWSGSAPGFGSACRMCRYAGCPLRLGAER